ncbi:MAG: hypothetical protein KY476_00195 [Planctomycetes bacterium]|nr:hypothetical protein [Planctomycetota bacterium]
MLKAICALSVAFALIASADAGVKTGLKTGTPDIQQAGPLAFGPDGILFIGDPQSAAVFAVATKDKGAKSPAPVHVENVDEKLAELLGTEAAEIQINDLAVNPATGNVFLSVSRGRGPEAKAAIMKVDGSGEISQLELKNVEFAKAELPDAPAADAQDRRGRNLRTQSITDIQFIDGYVYLAGLSNEEFASKLRAIAFPFEDPERGTSVEIFHGAHGQFETRSPVRTFTNYEIEGNAYLLGAYTCTPLVKFPLAELKPGKKIRGTTVAELGNRNNPLDMIVYQQGGKDYLLIANSRRGVMKVTTEGLADAEGIEEKIPNTAGLTYETVENLKDVTQLDKLNEKSAVILVSNGEGAHLKTIALP